DKQTKEYPYVLNTGRGTVGQWHTQTRTREVQIIENMISKEPYIEISKEIAENLNINNGDKIEVSSVNGKKVEVLGKINEGLKSDELYGPMHYIETNILTRGSYDAYSREPSYKYATVNVKKVN
ncbi:MAG: molybdopterin dinucleotide binding domain-containing protein, partial [Clostridium sp.]